MEIIERTYLNPKEAASFSSPGKIYHEIKKQNKNVTKKQITEWLKKQEAYTLHKPARRKFSRNRVVVGGLDYQWDADTMDMTSYKASNNEYKYVLVIIDIFSRYLWTRPLKTKRANEVKTALENVLKGNRKPSFLRTDKGTEFLNSYVSHFLKENEIDHFVTQNETKANYAERVIKTLKSKISRYFTHHQSHKWTDVLSAFTDSYNKTYHRSINQTPESVSKQNEARIWFEQYNKIKKKGEYFYFKKKYAFNVNDYVRVSYLRGTFEREYDQKWTGEIFIVKSRRRRDGIELYHLIDFNGDEISGSFYKDELQKITADPTGVYKIEKVLRHRKYKGKKQFLVRWLFWPPKYDTWVDASELSTL